MKIIYNKFIPFPGFKAINLFGVLFVRNGCVLSESDLNHEAIHTEQMKEMCYVFFYIWYIVEWLVRLFKDGNAYLNISFEKEAYDNQNWISYLENRTPFTWTDYL